MEQSVQSLINKFLKPPKGNSSEAIRDKIQFWVERANHPEKHSQDNSQVAIADVRRKARQNARRIIMRHPEIASQLAKEREAA